jgi:hypothetical protein
VGGRDYQDNIDERIDTMRCLERSQAFLTGEQDNRMSGLRADPSFQIRREISKIA